MEKKYHLHWSTKFYLKMKRIIVICEGRTEQEFIKSTLGPHFQAKGIYLVAPLIKHSMGGIVKWDILKQEIEKYLFTEKDAFVTTLIDYYGLNPKHNFPLWTEAESIIDKIAMCLSWASMRSDGPALWAGMERLTLRAPENGRDERGRSSMRQALPSRAR